MDIFHFIEILSAEIDRAVGCTEIGAVALGVSRASAILGCTPEKIDLSLSPNVFKNAINVGVPGTKLRGTKVAAALGACMPDEKAGLAILDGVNDQVLSSAQQLVSQDCISVVCADTDEPVYVYVAVSAGENSVQLTISGGHANVIQIVKNGTLIQHHEKIAKKEKIHELQDYSVKDLVNFILAQDAGVFHFLMEHAETNLKAARSGLESPDLRFARALNGSSDSLPVEIRSIEQVRYFTAAASEARMAGMKIPVMALTGSGNHGIANFLGIYILAKELGVSEEQLAYALAITTMITIYIKAYTGKMTAYCGCAIAPATGVAAGGVYLMGGDYEQMEAAMQSVIGTYAGMLCDGAKISCAYKVSTASASAVQFAQLACKGAFVPVRDGIIGRTIEETFQHLGEINNPGMRPTDQVVINILSRMHG